MTPKAQSVTHALLQSLDGRVRQGVVRRVEAMERELTFLSSREDANVIYLRRRGWGDDRIQVFFVLNSVYQQVLGPVQAAARGGPEGLGTAVPVNHGKTSFNSSAARNVSAALRDFYVLIDELKIQRPWLYANTCRDAVYLIADHERNTSTT